MLALLLLYAGIMRITDLLLKGNRGILIYIEIILYWVTAYRLSHENLDQHVKSRMHIYSGLVSTKRHGLIIEHKKDILNLEEILEDMDAMISPMRKDAILIKLLFNTID